MSEKSRVKKYENLRKEINSNHEGDEISESTRRKVLGHVSDPSINNEQQDALRAKQSKTTSSRDDSFVSALMDEGIDAEQNEYFDDFIDEVRQYNIDKGAKSDYNTQIDILRQLKESSEQRKRYVEEIEEDQQEDLDEVYTSTLSSEEIAQQVRSLIFETQESDVVEEAEEFDLSDASVNTDSFEDSDLIEIIPQDEDIEVVESQDNPDMTIQIQLLEETQQLRKQVNTYKSELTDISEDLSKNNKLINRILVFLIIVLVGCVFFFGYVLITKLGSI